MTRQGSFCLPRELRKHAALERQFRERTPERVYLAVVYGHPTPPLGHVARSSGVGGKALIQKETHPKDPRAAEAISHYTVVEQFESTSLVEVRYIPASATKSASRHAFAATRWWAKFATPMDLTSCGRSPSNVRRSTPGVSVSLTRPTGGRCDSKRRYLMT